MTPTAKPAADPAVAKILVSDEKKAEIAANWSRAEDSIAAAKTLVEAGFYDFAASRAYYAGFHAAAAARSPPIRISWR
jgi:rhodanese-related sulfurtransferase